MHSSRAPAGPCGGQTCRKEWRQEAGSREGAEGPSWASSVRHQTGGSALGRCWRRQSQGWWPGDQEGRMANQVMLRTEAWVAGWPVVPPLRVGRRTRQEQVLETAERQVSRRQWLFIQTFPAQCFEGTGLLQVGQRWRSAHTAPRSTSRQETLTTLSHSKYKSQMGQGMGPPGKPRGWEDFSEVSQS